MTNRQRDLEQRVAALERYILTVPPAIIERMKKMVELMGRMQGISADDLWDETDAAPKDGA